MEKLVKELTEMGVLKTSRIIEAFKATDRKDFVLEEYKNEAYENIPLPIGYGQTISQPYTVAFMLELLQPNVGNKIMDVGSGSGWTTALLAHITGEKGRIFSIELIPELKKFGEENVSKYNFIKKEIVQFLSINAVRGISEEAPFDRILSGASAHEVPSAWKKQLKIGGRIVIPIRDSIHLLIKKSEKEFSDQEFSGFAFVPFITNNSKKI